LGELFSKIMILISAFFLFFKNYRKFKIAVKVRFFASIGFSSKIRREDEALPKS